MRRDRAPRLLYLKTGSLTLEEVARTRGLKLGAVAGHLAACLDGGLTFEWDRRRLVIDPALEAKVLHILKDRTRVRERKGRGSLLSCVSGIHGLLHMALYKPLRRILSFGTHLCLGYYMRQLWQHTAAPCPYHRRLVMHFYFVMVYDLETKERWTLVAQRLTFRCVGEESALAATAGRSNVKILALVLFCHRGLSYFNHAGMK